MATTKPIAVLVLLAVTGTSNVLADDRDERLRQRTWQKHWKAFAQKCVEIDGEYFTCPLYDPEFESSAHIDATQDR